MIISDRIKGLIDTFPLGRVFTVADFDVERQYCGALIKSLNRMAEQGVLQRLSKGKYYKPQQSVFGTLPPSETEIVKDYLEKAARPSAISQAQLLFRLHGIDNANFIKHTHWHK